MTKNYLLLFLATGAIASLAFRNPDTDGLEKMSAAAGHRINSSGAPVGMTGAPGDNNCTLCHSGSVQDGSANSLIVADANGPVTDYVPGTTYNVGVTFAGAGIRNGFEVLALSVPGDAQAGAMTGNAALGTKVINGSAGKKYVTHNTTGNTQTAWTFQWTAPAANVGTVRFYLATNQANNNGQNSGDIIRLSTHDLGSFASVKENTAVEFNVGFAAETHSLRINLQSYEAGKATLNLVDLSGKSVFFEQIGAVDPGENTVTVRLPESVKSGIYMAHIGVDNKFASKKIAIFK